MPSPIHARIARDRGPLRPRRTWTLALIAAALLQAPRVASAESIRSAVSKHVASELERNRAERQAEREEEEEEEAAERARRDRSRDVTVVSSASVISSEGGSGNADADPDFPWPWDPVARPDFRLFGRQAHVDLSLETAWHAWRPAQHAAVQLATETYRAYTLQVRARISDLIDVRLGLETDGHTWFRVSQPSVAPLLGNDGNAAGTARALAVLSLPLVFSAFLPFVQPVFRYERSAFGATATPASSVCLVAREADAAADPPACTRVSGPLQMLSSFESYLLGLEAGDPDFASIHLGMDIVAQRKPYQVSVDGRALDEYLFDTRFHGKGVAIGVRLGTDRGLSFGAGLRVGTAAVSLTDDLQLGDVLPPDYALGYTRWETSLGYGHVFWQGPPALQVRLGLDASGSHFEFTHAEAPALLSSDLFFVTRLALVLLL